MLPTQVGVTRHPPCPRHRASHHRSGLVSPRMSASDLPLGCVLAWDPGVLQGRPAEPLAPPRGSTPPPARPGRPGAARRAVVPACGIFGEAVPHVTLGPRAGLRVCHGGAVRPATGRVTTWCDWKLGWFQRSASRSGWWGDMAALQPEGGPLRTPQVWPVARGRQAPCPRRRAGCHLWRGLRLHVDGG